jgi:hypothetical protein
MARCHVFAHLSKAVREESVGQQDRSMLGVSSRKFADTSPLLLGTM